MGGQRGGMVDESGSFPEVCKKSVQAMAADLQGAIKPEVLEELSFRRLQGMTPRELEQLGRITTPLLASGLDDRFRPVTWAEAMDRVVRAMGKTPPDRSFYYLSGRSSNEAAFLMQLLARLRGTNNVNNCSYFCHQASGVGLSSVTGSGTATVSLEDLDTSDLVVLIGANPASNHPRFMKHLMQVKRRGGRVVVINPVHEVGLQRFKVPSDVRSMLRATRIADLYIKPNMGGDALLLLGLVKRLIERDAIDRAFIEHHADGWSEFETVVGETSWKEVSACGVSRDELDRLADLYMESKATVFAWAMGVTHHLHGVDTVRMIANAAISRGMLGRPGAGLLPLRGHSNVQGIGSVGVVPALKKAFFDSLDEVLGGVLPTSPGWDTMSCIDAAHEGNVDLAVCLGGNLYGSNPDAVFTAEAMQGIGTVVYMSTTLNTGHAWGRGRETIVLPVLARDEEPQATTQESMFSFVRLSEGGPFRHEGPRAETDVIVEMGDRVLGNNGPVRWSQLSDHDEIRKMIAAVVPGYGAIDDIGETKQEFQIEGRIFHTPHFATPTGRCMVHAIRPTPPAAIESNQVRIATLRSEGQFNTVVYEDHDFYRGQERRDVILLNADDMRRMDIDYGQRVRVQTSTGSIEVLARAYDVAEGNAAMYYPEANAIVPRSTDPASLTPAFKAVVGTIIAL